MDRAAINLELEHVEEFMDMLTGGRLPKGMSMKDQPQLTRDQAFTVVWYLQEHLRLIPSNYEMCCVCGELYDANQGGFYLSEDAYADDPEWYSRIAVTREMVRRYEGRTFGSSDCEVAFWQAVKRSEADDRED